MEKEIKNRFEKVEKRVDSIENTISKGTLSKKGKLVRCDKCKHLWRTQSKFPMVSCPSCGYKVKIK